MLSSPRLLYSTDSNDLSPIFDFQIFAPSLPEEGVTRRSCFNVSITDDNFHENTESFEILLELDIFTPQYGVIVNPSITEIFIIDNDGKSLCY